MCTLSKEEFIRCMERIVVLESIREEVNNVYRRREKDTLYVDYPTFGGEMVYEEMLVGLLEKAMNDKYEYIVWWLYDCDYGKNVEADSVVEEDGTAVDLRELSDLYDYIVKSAESEE